VPSAGSPTVRTAPPRIGLGGGLALGGLELLANYAGNKAMDAAEIPHGYGRTGKGPMGFGGKPKANQQEHNQQIQRIVGGQHFDYRGLTQEAIMGGTAYGFSRPLGGKASARVMAGYLISRSARLYGDAYLNEKHWDYNQETGQISAVMDRYGDHLNTAGTGDMFKAEILNLAGDMGGGTTIGGGVGGAIGGVANIGVKGYSSRKSNENFEVVRLLDALDVEEQSHRQSSKMSLKHSTLSKVFQNDPGKLATIQGLHHLRKLNLKRADLMTYRNNDEAYNKDWNWYDPIDVMSSAITRGRGDLANFTESRKRSLQKTNEQIQNFQWNYGRNGIEGWSTAKYKRKKDLTKPKWDTSITNTLLKRQAPALSLYSDARKKLENKRGKAEGFVPNFAGKTYTGASAMSAAKKAGPAHAASVGREASAVGLSNVRYHSAEGHVPNFAYGGAFVTNKIHEPGGSSRSGALGAIKKTHGASMTPSSSRFASQGAAQGFVPNFAPPENEDLKTTILEEPYHPAGHTPSEVSPATLAMRRVRKQLAPQSPRPRLTRPAQSSWARRRLATTTQTNPSRAQAAHDSRLRGSLIQGEKPSYLSSLEQITWDPNMGGGYGGGINVGGDLATHVIGRGSQSLAVLNQSRDFVYKYPFEERSGQNKVLTDILAEGGQPERMEFHQRVAAHTRPERLLGAGDDFHSLALPQQLVGYANMPTDEQAYIGMNAYKPVYKQRALNNEGPDGGWGKAPQEAIDKAMTEAGYARFRDLVLSQDPSLDPKLHRGKSGGKASGSYVDGPHLPLAKATERALSKIQHPWFWDAAYIHPDTGHVLSDIRPDNAMLNERTGEFKIIDAASGPSSGFTELVVGSYLDNRGDFANFDWANATNDQILQQVEAYKNNYKDFVSSDFAPVPVGADQRQSLAKLRRQLVIRNLELPSAEVPRPFNIPAGLDSSSASVASKVDEIIKSITQGKGGNSRSMSGYGPPAGNVLSRGTQFGTGSLGWEPTLGNVDPRTLMSNTGRMAGVQDVKQYSPAELTGGPGGYNLKNIQEAVLAQTNPLGALMQATMPIDVNAPASMPSRPTTFTTDAWRENTKQFAGREESPEVKKLIKRMQDDPKYHRFPEIPEKESLAAHGKMGWSRYTPAYHEELGNALNYTQESIKRFSIWQDLSDKGHGKIVNKNFEVSKIGMEYANKKYGGTPEWKSFNKFKLPNAGAAASAPIVVPPQNTPRVPASGAAASAPSSALATQPVASTYGDMGQDDLLNLERVLDGSRPATGMSLELYNQNQARIKQAGLEAINLPSMPGAEHSINPWGPQKIVGKPENVNAIQQIYKNAGIKFSNRSSSQSNSPGDYIDHKAMGVQLGYGESSKDLRGGRNLATLEEDITKFASMSMDPNLQLRGEKPMTQSEAMKDAFKTVLMSSKPDEIQLMREWQYGVNEPGISETEREARRLKAKRAILTSDIHSDAAHYKAAQGLVMNHFDPTLKKLGAPQMPKLDMNDSLARVMVKSGLDTIQEGGMAAVLEKKYGPRMRELGLTPEMVLAAPNEPGSYITAGEVDRKIVNPFRADPRISEYRALLSAATADNIEMFHGQWLSAQETSGVNLKAQPLSLMGHSKTGVVTAPRPVVRPVAATPALVALAQQAPGGLTGLAIAGGPSPLPLPNSSAAKQSKMIFDNLQGFEGARDRMGVLHSRLPSAPDVAGLGGSTQRPEVGVHRPGKPLSSGSLSVPEGTHLKGPSGLLYRSMNVGMAAIVLGDHGRHFEQLRDESKQVGLNMPRTELEGMAAKEAVARLITGGFKGSNDVRDWRKEHGLDLPTSVAIPPKEQAKTLREGFAKWGDPLPGAETWGKWWDEPKDGAMIGGVSQDASKFRKKISEMNTPGEYYASPRGSRLMKQEMTFQGGLSDTMYERLVFDKYHRSEVPNRGSWPLEQKLLKPQERYSMWMKGQSFPSWKIAQRRKPGVAAPQKEIKARRPLGSYKDVANPPRKYHTGGKVKGNQPDIPAFLAPGEFVMQKSAVDRIGTGNLQTMNAGGHVPNFQNKFVSRVLFAESPAAQIPAIRELISNRQALRGTKGKDLFTRKYYKKIIKDNKITAEEVVRQPLQFSAIGDDGNTMWKKSGIFAGRKDWSNLTEQPEGTSRDDLKRWQVAVTNSHDSVANQGRYAGATFYHDKSLANKEDPFKIEKGGYSTLSRIMPDDSGDPGKLGDFAFYESRQNKKRHEKIHYKGSEKQNDRLAALWGTKYTPPDVFGGQQYPFKLRQRWLQNQNQKIRDHVVGDGKAGGFVPNFGNPLWKIVQDEAVARKLYDQFVQNIGTSRGFVVGQEHWDGYFDYEGEKGPKNTFIKTGTTMKWESSALDFNLKEVGFGNMARDGKVSWKDVVDSGLGKFEVWDNPATPGLKSIKQSGSGELLDFKQWRENIKAGRKLDIGTGKVTFPKPKRLLPGHPDYVKPQQPAQPKPTQPKPTQPRPGPSTRPTNNPGSGTVGKNPGGGYIWTQDGGQGGANWGRHGGIGGGGGPRNTQGGFVRLSNSSRTIVNPAVFRGMSSVAGGTAAEIVAMIIKGAANHDEASINAMSQFQNHDWNAGPMTKTDIAFGTAAGWFGNRHMLAAVEESDTAYAAQVIKELPWGGAAAANTYTAEQKKRRDSGFYGNFMANLSDWEMGAAGLVTAPVRWSGRKALELETKKLIEQRTGKNKQPIIFTNDPSQRGILSATLPSLPADGIPRNYSLQFIPKDEKIDHDRGRYTHSIGAPRAGGFIPNFAGKTHTGVSAMSAAKKAGPAHVASVQREAGAVGLSNVRYHSAEGHVPNFAYGGAFVTNKIHEPGGTSRGGALGAIKKTHGSSMTPSSSRFARQGAAQGFVPNFHEDLSIAHTHPPFPVGFHYEDRKTQQKIYAQLMGSGRPGVTSATRTGNLFKTRPNANLGGRIGGPLGYSPAQLRDPKNSPDVRGMTPRSGFNPSNLSPPPASNPQAVQAAQQVGKPGDPTNIPLIGTPGSLGYVNSTNTAPGWTAQAYPQLMDGGATFDFGSRRGDWDENTPFGNLRSFGQRAMKIADPANRHLMSEIGERTSMAAAREYFYNIRSYKDWVARAGIQRAKNSPLPSSGHFVDSWTKKRKDSVDLRNSANNFGSAAGVGGGIFGQLQYAGGGAALPDAQIDLGNRETPVALDEPMEFYWEAAALREQTIQWENQRGKAWKNKQNALSAGIQGLTRPRGGGAPEWSPFGVRPLLNSVGRPDLKFNALNEESFFKQVRDKSPNYKAADANVNASENQLKALRKRNLLLAKEFTNLFAEPEWRNVLQNTAPIGPNLGVGMLTEELGTNPKFDIKAGGVGAPSAGHVKQKYNTDRGDAITGLHQLLAIPNTTTARNGTATTLQLGPAGHVGGGLWPNFETKEGYDSVPQKITDINDIHGNWKDTGPSWVSGGGSALWRDKDGDRHTIEGRGPNKGKRDPNGPRQNKVPWNAMNLVRNLTGEWNKAKVWHRDMQRMRFHAEGFIPNFSPEDNLSTDQKKALEEYKNLLPGGGDPDLEELRSSPAGSVGAKVWSSIQAGSISPTLKDFIRDKISGGNRKQFSLVGGAGGSFWQRTQAGGMFGQSGGKMYGSNNPEVLRAMQQQYGNRRQQMERLGMGGIHAGLDSGYFENNKALERVGRFGWTGNQNRVGFGFGDFSSQRTNNGAMSMGNPPSTSSAQTPPIDLRAQFESTFGRLTEGPGGRMSRLPRGFASGHVPNFNMSSVIEKASARSLGYNPGAVKPITLNGTKAVYNTAETVKHIPGFSAPFINPPQHSQAGINHRASAITQTGVNPYKAEGHVPNFINTTSQMARPEGAAQAIEIPGVMSLNSSVQTLQQAATLMATSLSGLKEQMGALATQVAGLASTGLKVDEGRVEHVHTGNVDHGSMTVSHNHAGSVSVDNTDINNIIDNKLSVSNLDLSVQERANRAI
jgi:hypothetical protein